MIHFTVDIDWAPEEVIADTVELFNRYEVPCTLFATHRSEALLECDRSRFEIGLHPNFNSLLRGEGGDPDCILDELIAYYPKARAIRSHSLTQNGWLLTKFKEKGMLYELNHFLPYHSPIKPFMLWCGLLRIPFNWEDDYHFALNYSFDNSRIDLNSTGLNIFNFHPIHVYLNSERIDRFLAVKQNMADIDLLLQHRNKGPVKGTRDILVDLLEESSRQTDCPSRMVDLYSNFLSINHEDEALSAIIPEARK